MRTLCIIALLACTSCVFDGKLKHDNGVVPEPLDDGWQIDTPQSVGLSENVLHDIHRQLLDEDHRRSVLSLLVVKDRKLVFETYLRRPSDRDTVWPLQSATKSVTSLMVGIARDRGDVASLDLSLGEIFGDELADLDSRKRAITLRQLLTMTSGIAFDNDVFYTELWVDHQRPTGRLRYMLDKALYADPGEKFYYRDVDPQLVSYALSRLTGQSELALARESLFAGLGIEDYDWEEGPDRVTMGAAGLRLKPRALCKLGQLLLDRGMWNGERVVSEDWIAESTKAQIDSDTPYEAGVFPYGYYFWIVPDIGFAAWGHGGQFVLVVPDRNMVLVQTAFPYGDLADDDLGSFLTLVKPLLRSEQ